MKKKILFILIISCLIILAGIRIFSPEDTRVCDNNVLVKHGNPSAYSSGFFCSGGKLFVQ